MKPSIKYPHTGHLYWSQSLQNDDKMIQNMSMLEACRDVVVTEKRDGENSTLGRDFIHARSLDSRNHISRSWVKQLHGSIKHDIPEWMRICGENLYAVHSIAYNDLPTYFEVFNIWRDNTCLSWDLTMEWCDLLGLQTVPVLYRGPWNEMIIRGIIEDKDMNKFEGYVVRIADSFTIDAFPYSIAKYVRKGHVQTDEHWMERPVVPNKLKL